MEYRTLGKTGLPVSVLGFGCGSVGGLMVRGDPAEQVRAVARAIALGVRYFDTAQQYGNGESERSLGRALRTLGARVTVGTKFRLTAADRPDLASAVGRSLEGSLARLGLERVDLLQLHNRIAPDGADAVTVAEIRDQIVPALVGLRERGLIGHFGITALGDPVALKTVIGDGAIETAQVVYNLLNPSADVAVSPGFPAPNFAGILDDIRAHNLGALAIRVLAGGALTCETERHPVAIPTVQPIGSARDYATDVRHAALFATLVAEGFAASLTEAAIRFALSSDAISTVLVGVSSAEQLEFAARAIDQGPLPPEALARLPALWAVMAG